MIAMKKGTEESGKNEKAAACMLAAIRVRGNVNLKKETRHALNSLTLSRVNHLVLRPENNANRKQMDVLRAYITYGEIDRETLIKLLVKRARVAGNKRMDERVIRELKLKGVEEIAEALLSGKKKLGDFGVKPVFRLRPPRKGYERAGIKKDYTIGGALGYRAGKINKLIAKMI